MFSALTSRSKINILQSPSILVRDQQEASIEVGSDVPTATSTTATTTTDTLTQNIEYRTVGIKLKIKPTISEEKTVVLDIEQEVSSVGDSVQVGGAGNLFPSFTTTKTKTSIVVPNQQGIVIGGIMEETKSKGYQGIPLLSSIPILGNLFRYSVDTVTKKELVIFITPHVIVNETEADKLTKNYLKNLRELKMHFEEIKDRIPLH
jgi:general secretion pathway protein D